MSTPWFYWREKKLFLKVWIQTRASQDEVVGLHGGYLKLRLTAPPLEGRANQHLIKFLAKSFKVPLAHIVITKGKSSRQKTVCIERPQDLHLLATA